MPQSRLCSCLQSTMAAVTRTTVEHLPDSVLLDILSQASGVRQEQQQQQQEPVLISTRKQQRYLCGIFTRVSQRWRLAALSICTGLDVWVADSRATKVLSSWLRRNGIQLQHLSLGFLTSPGPLLSILPSSTPQLRNLRINGMYYLKEPITALEAPAWGALTNLTRLELDVLDPLAPAVRYLTNLVELSTSDLLCSFYHRSFSSLLKSVAPQLRVLHLRCAVYTRPTISRPGLDVLSSMQQLQQVNGITVDAADLDHPLVVKMCYPILQIALSTPDSSANVEDWVRTGGGSRSERLCITSPEDAGVKPVLPHWEGVGLLRELELHHVDLGPVLQQLRGLTQLTQLQMVGCSPDLLSLDQLPSSLCSLSLDNFRYQQQQQQHDQWPGTDTSWLQHLTSIVLVGRSAFSPQLRALRALPGLQQLVLERQLFMPSASLSILSEMSSISSLSIPHIGSGEMVLESITLLAGFPGLRRLEVSKRPVTTLHGLEMAAKLGHLTSIQVCVASKARPWVTLRAFGGPLQVRGSFGLHLQLTWVCLEQGLAQALI